MFNEEKSVGTTRCIVMFRTLATVAHAPGLVSVRSIENCVLELILKTLHVFFTSDPF